MIFFFSAEHRVDFRELVKDLASRFHCRIELEGDRYALIDLKSRNGTLLNGARIDRAVLKPNDQIQLGSTKVSYLESV